MHHRFNILTLSLKKINYKRQIKSIFFKIGLSLFFNIFINQFNMSHIYDWFERGDIKSKSKDEKGVDLITYYYKCKVCLEKLNEEQLKSIKVLLLIEKRTLIFTNIYPLIALFIKKQKKNII